MDAGMDAVWPFFALRLRSERLVFGREIVAKPTNLSPTDLERFGITHIAGAQNFRIEHTCGFQSLHVGEIRKLERMLKRVRIRRRLAERGEDRTEIFGRRSAQ